MASFINKIKSRLFATNNDTTTKDKQTEPVGGSGTAVYGGMFEEEYLADLKGQAAAETYDRMRRNDPQIVKNLKAVTNPIKSGVWEIKSPDIENKEYEKQREFVEHVLFNDLNKSFKQLIGEILTCIPFGYSIFEKVHENKTSKAFGSYTGYKCIAFRSQKTIEKWNFDHQTERLESITQSTFGDFVKYVDIPAEFLSIFTLAKEGVNYEGISPLRSCYGSWYRKNTFLKLEAIGIEKTAFGTPVGTTPVGATKVQVSDFEDVLESYFSSEQQYIILPQGFELDIKTMSFEPNKIQDSIKKEDAYITGAFVASFLELGQGGNGGAYALGTDLSDFFLSVIQEIADNVCETITATIIKELIIMNYGEQDEYPYMTCSGINDKAGKEFAEVLNMSVQSGLLTPDEELERHFRERYKLPELPEGAREALKPEPEPEPEKEEKEEIKDDEKEKGFSVTNFASNPSTARALIDKGSESVEEAMQEGLQNISSKLIHDIIREYKKLPENNKVKALNNVKLGGKNQFKKDLKNTYINIAVMAKDQVLSEVGVIELTDPLNVNKPYDKVDYSKLPKHVRDQLALQVALTVDAQAADLQKSVYFAFNGNVDKTLDYKVIEQELTKASDKYIEGVATQAGAVTTASTIVNKTRKDVFFDDDVIDKIDSFTFVNPSPVSAICQELTGRTFKSDDADSWKFRPPLHHRCKSYLKANLKSKKTPTITEGGLTTVTPAAYKSVTLEDKQ